MLTPSNLFSVPFLMSKTCNWQSDQPQPFLAAWWETRTVQCLNPSQSLSGDISPEKGGFSNVKFSFCGAAAGEMLVEVRRGMHRSDQCPPSWSASMERHSATKDQFSISPTSNNSNSNSWLCKAAWRGGLQSRNDWSTGERLLGKFLTRALMLSLPRHFCSPSSLHSCQSDRGKLHAANKMRKKELKMGEKEKELDELTLDDQSGDLRGINQLQPIQADLPPWTATPIHTHLASCFTPSAICMIINRINMIRCKSIIWLQRDVADQNGKIIPTFKYSQIISVLPLISFSFTSLKSLRLNSEHIYICISSLVEPVEKSSVEVVWEGGLSLSGGRCWWQLAVAWIRQSSPRRWPHVRWSGQLPAREQ